MHSKIPLDNLLEFSEIYDLGVTESDVTTLRTLSKKYKRADPTKTPPAGRHTMNTNYTFAYKLKPLQAGERTIGYSSQYEDECHIDQKLAGIPETAYPYVCTQARQILFRFLPEPEQFEMLMRLTNQFSSSNYSYATDITEPQIFDTVEQFKAYCINNLERVVPLMVNDYYCKDESIADGDLLLIKGLYWLADKKFTGMNRGVSLPKRDVPLYIFRITEILTFGNKRVAFCHGLRNTATSGVFIIYITIPTEPRYNYTDVGRFLSHESSVQRSVFRLYYDDATTMFPRSADGLTRYVADPTFNLIDNATVDSLVKRLQKTERSTTERLKLAELISTKMKARIKGLSKDEPFEFNDITFRKTEFEYEGQIIGSTTTGVNTMTLLENFSGSYTDENLNFERLFNTFCENMAYKLTRGTAITGRLGSVTFEGSLQQTSGTSKLTKINGYRINKAELVDALKQGLCYQNQADYDSFLEAVEYCSLRFHAYLSTGIDLQVEDEINGIQLVFKLYMERQKNKNYLVLADRKIKIGDTNKLLTLATARNMTKVIEVLLDPKIVGLKGSDIRELIKDGVRAYKEIKKKEEAWLLDTLKKFDVQVLQNVQMTSGAGERRSGYLIKGKLRQYLISNDNTNKYGVYEYPSGRYICIVDKGGNYLSPISRLISRIYALANDSKLAKEINTL